MIAFKYLFPTLLVTTAFAAELKLEEKPFNVSHNLKAIVLPETVVPVRIDAKSAATFEIVTLAEHGRLLKKGEPMITFKADAIDRKLADLKQAISAAELGLAQAKLELSTLEKTVPEQLLRIERGAKIAAEELAYFESTRRKADEETADQSLKRHEQSLASYEEELKQLLKMYEADDITEETEEIILKKQKDAVAFSEFALRMQKLEHKRTLSVDLPRQLVTLTEKRDDTALQLSNAKQNLPRSLELKKIEVANLETSLKRQREDLADLEHDRKLFELTAPADGLFYHGAIENGAWSTAEILKILTPKGVVPTGKIIASFIPGTSKLAIESLASQADAQALSVGAKGFAMLSGKGDILIPVTATKISNIPNTLGTYLTTFSAEWPKSVTPVPGHALEVKMISYSKDKAITVPSKAITFGANGWTIEVKLADGKTEHRVVTCGKSAGDLTEITSGAEAGQVVIVP